MIRKLQKVPNFIPEAEVHCNSLKLLKGNAFVLDEQCEGLELRCEKNMVGLQGRQWLLMTCWMLVN